MAALVDIPPEFFRPERFHDVVRFLRLAAAPGKDKARAYRRWAAWVGQRVEPAIVVMLDQSGVEGTPTFELPEVK